MARRNELTCDRCGQVIANMDISTHHFIKELSAKIDYWGVGVPRSYGGQRIDLCTKCAEDFIKFINNENVGGVSYE